MVNCSNSSIWPIDGTLSVNLGVMAMKRYSTSPKAPRLKPHYQMQFIVIPRTHDKPNLKRGRRSVSSGMIEALSQMACPVVSTRNIFWRNTAQPAGAVECADCILLRSETPPTHTLTCVMDITLNHQMLRFQFCSFGEFHYSRVHSDPKWVR